MVVYFILTTSSVIFWCLYTVDRYIFSVPVETQMYVYLQIYIASYLLRA